MKITGRDKAKGHFTGLSFWVWNLCVCKGPHTQKDPTLSLIFCCHPLEIPNNFIFELVFYNWNLWDNWAFKSGGVFNMCVHSSLPAHELRIPGGLAMCGRSLRRWGQAKHVMSATEWAGLLTALRGHSFPENQNTLRTQKKHNNVVRNTMPRELCHILSFLYCFPELANHIG